MHGNPPLQTKMQNLSKTSGVTEYFRDFGLPQSAPFKPMWGPREQQQLWGKYPRRQISSMVHGAVMVSPLHPN
jgi:hypothetical protein